MRISGYWSEKFSWIETIWTVPWRHSISSCSAIGAKPTYKQFLTHWTQTIVFFFNFVSHLLKICQRDESSTTNQNRRYDLVPRVHFSSQPKPELHVHLAATCIGRWVASELRAPAESHHGGQASLPSSDWLSRQCRNLENMTLLRRRSTICQNYPQLTSSARNCSQKTLHRKFETKSSNVKMSKLCRWTISGSDILHRSMQ